MGAPYINRHTGQFGAQTNAGLEGAAGGGGVALIGGRGYIAGRVSSVNTADGDPRSIAGTFGYEAHYESNAREAYIGAFVAPITRACRDWREC